ncbi:ATP-binding protein [Candidatus Woesearchaeota archaeon]|nr:ATP-binding protein [Candidatus Woesearchaeota archaeon]
MKFSLNDILNLSINNASSLANIYKVYGFGIKIETNLSKECDKKIFSSFDANELKHNVFDNILFNSVWAITGVSSFEEFEKLKKKKGSVKITTKKQNDNFITEIYDTGIGIPKQDLNNIFKKGFSTRKSSGLGLYLARKTVKKFKGKIEIKSEKNKYTLVKVIL